MGVFDNNIESYKDFEDDLIEKEYDIEYDYVYAYNRAIKSSTQPIKCLISKTKKPFSLAELNRNTTYYHPDYVFNRCLIIAIVSAKTAANTQNIKLSDLDKSNMRVRFKKIVEGLPKLVYKGCEFIDINMSAWRNMSDKQKIISMMHSYIMTETQNSKYFKKK